MLYYFFFLIIRLPPRLTRTDTLFPYPTLFRSRRVARLAGEADGGVLAAGVAFEVVAELPVEDCPGTSGAFLAGGACRRGSGSGGGRGRRRAEDRFDAR